MRSRDLERLLSDSAKIYANQRVSSFIRSSPSRARPPTSSDLLGRVGSRSGPCQPACGSFPNRRAQSTPSPRLRRLQADCPFPTHSCTFRHALDYIVSSIRGQHTFPLRCDVFGALASWLRSVWVRRKDERYYPASKHGVQSTSTPVCLRVKILFQTFPRVNGTGLGVST
jgi:hypothetical protein